MSSGPSVDVGFHKKREVADFEVFSYLEEKENMLTGSKTARR